MTRILLTEITATKEIKLLVTEFTETRQEVTENTIEREKARFCSVTSHFPQCPL